MLGKAFTEVITRRDVRLGAAYAAALIFLATPAGIAMVTHRSDTASTASTTPPTAAPCHPTALPTLGGVQGNAVAVSSNGLVTGYAEDGGGTPQPVLWRAGKVTRIATGLAQVSPTAVNSRGEVVGHGVEPVTLEEVGWHWVGGRVTLLKVPTGAVASPSAISDSGLIVGGLASDDDGAHPASGEAPDRAAIWASAGTSARVLSALPGDLGAHAFGVNRRGVVVGISEAADHFTPVVWDVAGRVRALPGIGGSWGIARGIDDSGLVFGDVAPASGDPEAVVWDAGRSQKRLGPASGRSTQGKGVVHGYAVGQTEVRGTDGVDRPKALLWRGTSKPAPLPPRPGDAGAGVNAAAGNGLVVGFSSDARGVRRPMTWMCTS